MISFMNFSCKDWLDVNSEDDIYSEELFSTVDGYYTALNGLYSKLSDQSLYGENLVWYFNEAWGKSYDLAPDKNEDLRSLVSGDFENSNLKSKTEEIWKAAYKVIAEANALIQAKEADETTIFPYDGKAGDAVLGEAIAIRALMHFEMVKMFAPAPIVDNGGETAAIPYVTKFPSKINPLVKTNVILENVVNDLLRAKDLVMAIDTCEDYDAGYASWSTRYYQVRVKLYNEPGINSASPDEAWRYRGNKMNYYAILGTLARVYLYMGDYQNAYKYASMVTEKAGRYFVNLSSKYLIGNQMEDGGVINRLPSEMIFAVYNEDINDVVSTYFTSMDNSNDFDLFYIKDADYIFADAPDDVRAKVLYENRCMKFSLNGLDVASLEKTKCLIPVLRIAELYLIEAESSFDTDKANAINIFNYFVDERGNSSTLSLSESITKEEFMNAIVAEYRREFISEGINFYVHKRLNKPFNIEGGEGSTLENVVLPLPDSYSN